MSNPQGKGGFVPPDQAVRDLIVRSAESLLVEAGAGTGKTTALVDRLVRLVTHPDPSLRIEMRRIGAITFTEKAAAELSARLRRALENDGGSLAEAAIEQLDRAAIGTIHGFCQRLLHRYPIEAGLPPDFQAIDAIESSIAFDEWWEWFLDKSLGEHASEWTDALAAGLNERDVRELAAKFHRDWDRMTDLRLPSVPDGDPLPAFVTRFGDRIESAKPYPAKPDSLSKKLESLAAWHRDLCGDPRPIRSLRALKPFSTDRLGSKTSWGERLDSIRAELRSLQDEAAGIERQIAWSLASPLIGIVASGVRAYADERRRSGRIEFHDLLVLARDLLRDDADVRRDVSATYLRLLVDEFQDTDPLQLEIVRLAASPEGTLERERLFFVGDPQQSIYRFRRAELRLYEDAKELVDRVVPLTTNFRSRRGVIDWINARFSRMMRPFQPLDQPEPISESDNLSVRILEGPVEGLSAREVRRKEAESIALAIRRAMAEPWRVDGGRPLRFEDVAVLFPARTILPDLEAAFEAEDIPYRVESASLVYATQEARDLIAVLRAIENPADQVALVAALRTPAFARSDGELADYRSRGGRWDYRYGDLPGMEALRRYHDERFETSVGALAERIVRERFLMEIAVRERRPRDRWNRLMMLIDRCRAFDASVGGTLRQFLRWADRQAALDATTIERIAPEEDDDAVRLMTIHAAKGLEFPVTILAGLGSGESAASGPLVAWSAEGEIAIRVGSKERGYVRTPNAEAVLEDERALQSAEKDRLLYVGATRARDYLVASLFVPQRHEPGDEDVYQPLAVRLRNAMDAYEPMALDALATAPSKSDSAPVEPIDRDAWLRFRDDALSNVSKPDIGDANDEEPMFGYRAHRGSPVARAASAVLDEIDLSSGEGLSSLAGTYARVEGIPDRAGEVERIVRNALASTPLEEAKHSVFWRNVPISGEIDGRRFETTIDLLYRDTEGRYTIVLYAFDASDMLHCEERLKPCSRLPSFAGSVRRLTLLGADGFRTIA